AGGTASASIGLGSGTTPHGIAVSADGKTVYAAMPAINQQTISNVIPINAATNTTGPGIPIPLSPFTTPPTPFGLAMTPDGKTVYVGTSNFWVDAIVTATKTVTAQVSAPQAPEYCVVSPDGKTAWFSGFGSGSVFPIDVATNTVGTPIPVVSAG